MNWQVDGALTANLYGEYWQKSTIFTGEKLEMDPIHAESNYHKNDYDVYLHEHEERTSTINKIQNVIPSDSQIIRAMNKEKANTSIQSIEIKDNIDDNELLNHALMNEFMNKTTNIPDLQYYGMGSGGMVYKRVERELTGENIRSQAVFSDDDNIVSLTAKNWKKSAICDEKYVSELISKNKQEMAK
jgi:hypothetical protein